MLITTLTLDGSQLMSDAVAQIEGIPDSAYVIVRRRHGLEIYWYQFKAGFIRKMAATNTRGQVGEVLNLREAGAAQTFQIGDADLADGDRSGVVLDGAKALGILKPSTETTRAGGLTLDERATTRSAWPRSTPPAHIPTEELTYARSDEIPRETISGDTGSTSPEATVGADSEEEAEEEDVGQPISPTSVASPPPPFIAFPDLDCPDQVRVGETVELVVGLVREQVRGTAGGAITVDTRDEEFDVVVQLVADGFTLERSRDVLHVVRSDLAANTVSFSLIADPIEHELQPRILQVDYSYGGQLCGRAYRPITVTRTEGLTVTTTRTISMPMAISHAEDPPDLTITVTENDDSTQLEWQFVTPHDELSVPSGVVRRRFKEHNAKSFAMQQIRTANQTIGVEAIGNKMLGISRTVADQIPTEAWQVLSAVWTLTRSKGEIPYVLLVSSDPYIPWELASTDEEYLDQSLVDPEAPLILGAQVRMSRWTAPTPRGLSGMLNPPLPPPSKLVVGDMALVIGDYLAIEGIRPLPKAIEEGNMLAAKYGAFKLTATLAEVDPLFDGNLEREGARIDPSIVHFACHGQVDANNPGFNGIVLNQANQRLDPLYVAGNKMNRPFVFLNACQLGLGTDLLDNAGGMADEFLKTGATGFVAPLWSINDDLAQETAITFYETAIADGVPIAEVVRRRRAQFDPDSDPETTHLAYVYYGHPRLVFTKEG